ncbi:MAG: transcription termination/antitermination protein NusG [Cyanobacteriota bacterium]|nr:transcription termination/antitermination protein NusG [Cyanobacteriota bacterium]
MMMALTESSPPTLNDGGAPEEELFPPESPELETLPLAADLDPLAVDSSAGDPLAINPLAGALPVPLEAVPGEGVAGEAAEKPQVARWYAVQVASSCEKKVKATLEQRAITLGVNNRILDIEIPQTPGVKLKKDGTRQSIEEKVFPGYVLVRMILDEDTMMAVRSTPNVINFVGQEERRATGKTRGHIKPRPLSRSEVERIFRRATEKKAVVKVDLSEGDQILVTGGPFKDFQGEVIEVSAERSKLKALLSIFGRETPVELEFSQVSKQN